MNSRRSTTRPTQMDIARLAGVSQATVSLVVNGTSADGQVSADNRHRVLDAIDQLGYTVNTAARSLRGKGNRILGLYTFETVFPVDQRDFYFPFLLGVEEEAATIGYDLLLFSSAGIGGTRSIYAGGTNRLRRADGCVLLGRHLAREDLARLAHEDFPFVFIGHREAVGAEFSWVGADYESATRHVVSDLTALGHRRIVLLKAADGAEPGADRERGYRDAMKVAGLAVTDELVHIADDAHPLPVEAVQSWLASRVTAIVIEPTESQTTLRAFETAAKRAGIRIPDDISVAVLGDAPAPTARRSWTSFAIPREEMGRQAVRMLVELLENTRVDSRQILLPCRPVSGDSIGEPPAPSG